MTDYGTRKCKQCLKVFDKQSPLSMFCSYSCSNAYKLVKAGEKETKKITKQVRKPVKQVSDKRKKQNAAYLVARTVFLMEDRNKFCPVMLKIFNKSVYCTEIHHTNGRENLRLLDTVYWLAVSREGHSWIHLFPQLAREQGWLI